MKEHVIFKGEPTGKYCQDCGNEEVKLKFGGITCPYGDWPLWKLKRKGFFKAENIQEKEED